MDISWNNSRFVYLSETVRVFISECTKARGHASWLLVFFRLLEGDWASVLFDNFCYADFL